MLRRRVAIVLLFAATIATEACDRGAKEAPPRAVAPDARALRVLFIGNSYTAVNDLPAMVRAALLTLPSVASVDVAAIDPGGVTLDRHGKTGATLARIREGRWTHVVIQEQSVTACLDPKLHVAGATALASEVRAIGAQLLLYATWPRRAGDAIYKEPWTGGSPAAFERCLEAGFAQSVAATGAARVDVGAAWLRALAAKPDTPLYSDDGSHPTIVGSYLAACAFVPALAGARATDVAWHPEAIADADAKWLATIADAR